MPVRILFPKMGTKPSRTGFISEKAIGNFRKSIWPLARVDACADELCLMGVEREEVLATLVNAGGVGAPMKGMHREPGFPP